MRRLCRSLKGNISKKIPPNFAVAKYLGFTPLSPYESALHSLNRKYLATTQMAIDIALKRLAWPDHLEHINDINFLPLSTSQLSII
jgi:hypothetical protein